MAGWTDGSERRLENVLDGPVKFLHLERILYETALYWWESMGIDAASRDADGVTVDGA